VNAGAGACSASWAVPDGSHRAVFLDRDGTLIRNDGDLGDPERVELLPGVAEGVRHLLGGGYRLVVVTNQGGIGRGLYDEAAYAHLTGWMLAQLRERGIEVARVYHCPYHPLEGVGAYRRDSIDRKPGPGMLLRARDELGLDLGGSAMIGDQASDMQAAAAAGVRLRLWLRAPEAAPAEPGALRVASLAEAGRRLRAAFSATR